MIQCPKCANQLRRILTPNQVLLDQCGRCLGLWLDAGEINFFHPDKKQLEMYYASGLERASPTSEACPRCKIQMNCGILPGLKHQIEECPNCKGLWLDHHEFLNLSKPAHSTDSKATSKPAALRTPSLAGTTFVVLGSMYALLFGLLVFLSEAGKIDPNLGVVIAVVFVLLQFWLSPLLLDWSLRLLGGLTWVPFDALPEHLQKFMEDSCNRHNIPLPKIGLIADRAPQAYTYGRTPKSARMVLSQGTLEILTEDELHAVVAHELGHIVHWDFVVMTIAQLAPILFYQIYRICRRLTEKTRGSGKKQGSAAPLLAAAIVAYVAYIVSTYLVLFISRVREYYADRFSVAETKNPKALVTALAKIAYGLVESAPQNAEAEGTEKNSLSAKRRALETLSIMGINESKGFALAAYNETAAKSSVDLTALKEVMRWDFWSPWALYYELHSTHPLTAKRLHAIGLQALEMGQEPPIVFDQKKPESYWDDFAGDLAILALPLLGAIALSALRYFTSGVGYETPLAFFTTRDFIFTAFAGLSLGYLMKTVVMYPGGPFLENKTGALLRMVKVSPVQSYAVKLRGKIRGRGTPGWIFSEDLVFQDETGLLFVDYERPLGFVNLLFAIFRVKRYVGQDVEIEGWYRRAPIPYIELRRIRQGADDSRVYTFECKLAGGFILTCASFALWIFLR